MLEFTVEATNKPVKKFIETLMPSMITQLGLTNSRKAVLVKVTNEGLDGVKGSTSDIAFADCYLVLIKPPKRMTVPNLTDMALTLSHEMVHVRQLAKGQLKSLPKSIRVWMGKKYSKKTKYLDQPWEIDAYGRETGLLTKFAISENLWEIFTDFVNPAGPIRTHPIAWKNNLK